MANVTKTALELLAEAMCVRDVVNSVDCGDDCEECWEKFLTTDHKH